MQGSWWRVPRPLPTTTTLARCGACKRVFHHSDGLLFTHMFFTYRRTGETQQNCQLFILTFLVLFCTSFNLSLLFPFAPFPFLLFIFLSFFTRERGRERKRERERERERETVRKRKRQMKKETDKERKKERERATCIYYASFSLHLLSSFCRITSRFPRRLTLFSPWMMPPLSLATTSSYSWCSWPSLGPGPSTSASSRPT